jgi:hypothetical protein
MKQEREQVNTEQLTMGREQRRKTLSKTLSVMIQRIKKEDLNDRGSFTARDRRFVKSGK